MARFVVVLGADADARFPEGADSITVRAFPSAVGPADVTYLTRHGEEGYESPVPREMWIEVRGDAEAELVEGIGAYANAAAQFLPLIAVSANAWVGDAEPKLAFDATPQSTEREHFSNFVREEVGTLPRPGRNVDAAATSLAIAGGTQVSCRRADGLVETKLGDWIKPSDPSGRGDAPTQTAVALEIAIAPLTRCPPGGTLIGARGSFTATARNFDGREQATAALTFIVP